MLLIIVSVVFYFKDRTTTGKNHLPTFTLVIIIGVSLLLMGLICYQGLMTLWTMNDYV